MSEKEKRKSLYFGLPFIAIAIGMINGYISTGTTEGILIGIALGILLTIVAVLGIIPVGGVILYHFIALAVISVVNIDFTLLYWYCLIEAILYTIIGSLFACVIMLGR